MLIGANFLRSMRGGIRIEGDEITIYKKVTRIKTSNQTEIAEISELEVSEEEFLEINESIYFNQDGSKAFLEQFKPVIERLKHQGYIREEPLKHWKKNGELCKLDIINPDITIEDRPLKHVTPAMEDSLKKHVDSLLKIGAIRPSKSRHRTMAIIVNSGTTIDPVTGKEVKGKERMVFNYKSLNANTYEDQYSLPGINMIIKRIGGAKIFSKFDLKLGFHLLAMDEESILWTAFLVPGGLYEWLVLPFGLKNAPARGLIPWLRLFVDCLPIYQNISIMVQDTPIEEAAFMAIEERSWKPDKELPTQSISCEHDWKENAVTNYTICYYCGILTTDMSRLNCPKCQLTSCALCAKNYLGKTVNIKRKQQHKPEEEKDFSSNEVRLLKELLKEKTEQVQQMIKDQAKEYYEGKIAIKEKEELWQTERSLLLKAKRMKFEEEKDKEIKRLKAQLQEKKDKEIKFQFSEEKFPPLGNSQIARPFMKAEAHYSGSTTTAPKIRKITNQLYNVKVKFEIPNCPMFGTTAIIDTGASACCINKKVIPKEALEPLTQTVFFNGLNSRKQATHKIKQGYFLIEGNKFKIPLIYAFDMRDSNEIAELEVSEEEFLEINESIYFNQERRKAFLEQFKPVIERLKHQGYIGEEPLKHCKKNGTTIDPVTGKEVKRKERMVFNYKSLNDNTYKDQYSLPGINMIIKRIGGAKIFSKFDLKSGFHQVAMDEESILWTAFLVPGGLYEWLVMSFGLKKMHQQYFKERWINASKEQSHSSQYTLM
nr:TPA: orf y [Tanacetum cinerariifolium]